ncbi:MAG: hypothetical protein J7M25_15870 [Deltaproteobacteria bacterium]|nr:hypothetical protein [Deltaproteobacteria bacterium]
MMQLRFHKKLYSLSAIRQTMKDFEQAISMAIRPRSETTHHVLDLDSNDTILVHEVATRILLYSILAKKR